MEQKNWEFKPSAVLFKKYRYYSEYDSIQIVASNTSIEFFHYFNYMNPEANRRLEAYNANPRLPDGRYPTGYPGIAQSGMQNVDNYMMHLSQLVYQPYQYFGFPYSNGSFLNSIGGWRDPGLGSMNLTHEANSFRSYCNQQNTRVVPREMREKPQAKVINLDSDEDEGKQKNVLVPPNNNGIKQTQKQAQVINIDDNSEQKNQKVQESIVGPKTDLSTRPSKQEVTIQKVQTLQYKKKSKQVVIESKTKLIAKIKNREPKVQIKQQKPSKQRRKKVAENQKPTSKPQKQKQHQKVQKKKSERVAQKIQKQQKSDKADKPDKLDKTQKSDKPQKTDKNRKATQVQNKSKHEQGHTKQIAKYLESHGQIRHGKQFQSDIPTLKIHNNIRFNAWLEEKRRNILNREIGALTY